jgi:hypothetical protein
LRDLPVSRAKIGDGAAMLHHQDGDTTQNVSALDDLSMPTPAAFFAH